MPRLCVAGGCSNGTANGVSLFKWPRDQRVARNWTKFVKNTRVWTGPSKWSLLCSAHFEADCYEEISSVAREMGRKPKLKASAVPRIKSVSSSITSNEKENRAAISEGDASAANRSSSPTRPGPSTAAGSPRETAAYAMLALAESSFRVGDGSFDNVGDLVMMDLDHCFSSDTVMPMTSTPKPIRTAVEKRNRSRVLREIQLENTTLVHKPSNDCSGPSTSHVDTRKKPTKWSRGNQMKPVTDTKAVQCNLPILPERLEEEESDTESDHAESDESDDDFDPSDEEPDSDDSFICQSECPQDVQQKDRYFLVSESSLLKLFDMCPSCQSECDRAVEGTFGSCVNVAQKCKGCSYTRRWRSQPYVNETPAGNLMLSSAMLFCGAAISKIQRFLAHLGMPGISYQTFLNHQNRYLQPAISSVWETEREKVVNTIRASGGEFSAVGDGRADSPGHSAKFGTYTLMDTSMNKIVHMETVTVTEVSSSNAMEKEGLIRAIQYLEKKNLQLTELTTDRHSSIRKYLREEKAGIKHSLDVWHTSKGIGKQIDRLAKRKGYAHVKDWKKSISNHMYWCAGSTPDADPDVMEAKWVSLTNHVQNIHIHTNDKFPKCLHPPLASCNRKKKWLVPNDQATESLCDLLLKKSLLKDVRMLSTGQQTSHLEAYHAVVNHFAPKLTCFSHRGMTNRMMLAALHFNENAGRPQATTQEGEARFVLSYPKYKEGAPTVKKVLVSCTYNYVTALKTKVVELATKGVKLFEVEEPPTITSKFPRVDKEEAIINHRSRFGRHSE